VGELSLKMATSFQCSRKKRERIEITAVGRTGIGIRESLPKGLARERKRKKKEAVWIYANVVQARKGVAVASADLWRVNGEQKNSQQEN